MCLEPWHLMPVAFCLLNTFAVLPRLATSYFMTGTKHTNNQQKDSNVQSGFW